MGILKISEVVEKVEKRREEEFDDFIALLNKSIEEAFLNGRNSVFVSYSLMSNRIMIGGKIVFFGASFSPVEAPLFLEKVKKEALRAGYRVDGSCRFLKYLRISWEPSLSRRS